jgi:hypothetical protein
MRFSITLRPGLAILAVALAAFAASCKDKPAPPSSTAPATGDCKAQTDELRMWLAKIADKPDEASKPWPTGDAELNRQLDEREASLHAAVKAADPAQPAQPLTEWPIHSPLEETLKGCPGALEQLTRLGSQPEQARDHFVKIADAIAACGCNVQLPRAKGLLYLFAWGMHELGRSTDRKGLALPEAR